MLKSCANSCRAPAGTWPEVFGNCNAPRAVTYSAIIYCLRCMVDLDIPLNQGCLRPITIKVIMSIERRKIYRCAGNLLFKVLAPLIPKQLFSLTLFLRTTPFFLPLPTTSFSSSSFFCQKKKNPCKIPQGSLLWPSDGAAVVGGNVLTSQRVVDVVLKAFDYCADSQVRRARGIHFLV